MVAFNQQHWEISVTSNQKMSEQYRLTCKIILNSTIYWPKQKVRVCSDEIRISFCQNAKLLMMHWPRDSCWCERNGRL